MRLRLLLTLAVLALTVASFDAAAQGGATVTVSIVDLPATATVNAGQTHTASFSVNVVASGFQCTQPGSITVDIALSNAGAAPAGVTPTVDPANVTIPVPGPAVYGSPVPGLPIGEPLNESAPVTLRLVTTAAAVQGVFPATITASFAGGPAGPPGSCVGDLPGATATANHQVTINAGGGNTTTPPTSPPGTGGNNTDGNNTAPPQTPPRGSPGFEAAALAGAVALVAVAVRRRKA